MTNAIPRPATEAQYLILDHMMPGWVLVWTAAKGSKPAVVAWRHPDLPGDQCEPQVKLQTVWSLVRAHWIECTANASRSDGSSPWRITAAGREAHAAFRPSAQIGGRPLPVQQHMKRSA